MAAQNEVECACGDVPMNYIETTSGLRGPTIAEFQCVACSTSKDAAWITRRDESVGARLAFATQLAKREYKITEQMLIWDVRCNAEDFTPDMVAMTRQFVQAALDYGKARAAQANYQKLCEQRQ